MVNITTPTQKTFQEIRQLRLVGPPETRDIFNVALALSAAVWSPGKN